jgi:hypothetical protein
VATCKDTSGAKTAVTRSVIGALIINPLISGTLQCNFVPDDVIIDGDDDACSHHGSRPSIDLVHL